MKHRFIFCGIPSFFVKIAHSYRAGRRAATDGISGKIHSLGLDTPQLAADWKVAVKLRRMNSEVPVMFRHKSHNVSVLLYS